MLWWLRSSLLNRTKSSPHSGHRLHTIPCFVVPLTSKRKPVPRKERPRTAGSFLHALAHDTRAQSVAAWLAMPPVHMTADAVTSLQNSAQDTRSSWAVTPPQRRISTNLPLSAQMQNKWPLSRESLLLSLKLHFLKLAPLQTLIFSSGSFS
jgi:hypothetical protein